MDKSQNIYTYEVIATALDPVHQGGETTGTTLSELNRQETLWNGKSVAIPIVSANSIRHLLRESATYWWLAALGDDAPKLSERAYKLLFSGGGRASKGAESYVNLYEERQLREMFPQMSLFGGTMGNRMMRGAVRCSRALPVCKESGLSLPDYLQESAAQLSMANLIGVTSFSSFDPRENREYHRFAEPGIIEAFRQEQEAAWEEGEAGSDMKIRAEIEYLKSGTQLYFDITLFYPTPVDRGCLSGALGYMCATPFLGGKRNSGFGRVRFEFKEYEIIGPARVQKESDDATEMELAAETVRKHADTIKQMLCEDAL